MTPLLFGVAFNTHILIHAAQVRRGVDGILPLFYVGAQTVTNQSLRSRPRSYPTGSAMQP